MNAPHLNGHFKPAATKPFHAASTAGSKADAIRAKAAAHYERHADKWVAKRYTQMLLREGHQPALRPDGASDDRKSHLMRAAKHMVERKQHLRLARIDRAAQRMAGHDTGIGR